MSAFCRKLRFLVFFMVFYFIVCRIEEFLSMRRGWDWLDVVDPIKIRVRALKAVLARRGISSATSIERQDLVDLVRNSGRLTNSELAEVDTSNRPQLAAEPNAADIEAGVTSFANSAHFDELVEDCKDSAWLVEIRQHGAPVVPSAVWLQLNRYLLPFEIRVGRVECERRIVLCARKTFHHSGLLLAMPRGRTRIKDSVTFSWFTSKPELDAITRWLEAALASRVPLLDGGLAALPAVRNGSMALNGDFLVALDFDRLPQVPLFLSALSVRFTGRVRFWRLSPEDRGLLQQNFSSEAAFFLVNGNGPPYEYGARLDGSEPTSFRALAVFLKLSFPEANDTLIGLFYPVAMLALLSLAMRQKSLLARLIACAGSLLGYGILFLLLYLPAEHLLSLRCLQGARAALLAMCQFLARSDLGAFVRRDCLAERYSLLRLGIWFSIFLCFVAVFEKRRASEEEEEDESSSHDAEPSSRLPVPYVPETAQMDHMVTYLYSSLWLPPDEFAKAYVDQLPVWTCTQDFTYGSSDEETAAVDDEEAWPAGAMFARQCSVCLGDFRRGKALCHLPCGHVFHESCVKRWLRHPDTDSCPVCRWPAFKVK